MYAVITTGGKQYFVKEGEQLQVGPELGHRVGVVERAAAAAGRQDGGQRGGGGAGERVGGWASEGHGLLQPRAIQAAIWL